MFVLIWFCFGAFCVLVGWLVGGLFFGFEVFLVETWVFVWLFFYKEPFGHIYQKVRQGIYELAPKELVGNESVLCTFFP